MHRPQPLGVLPWPAGMLLLPDMPATASVAEGLLAGRVPQEWPPGLEFVGIALRGDPALAAEHLSGSDPVSRYNRAVLVGGDGVWEALAGDVDGELSALVGVGMFTVGLSDVPPALGEATGEIAALVHSARASAALEQGDDAAAVQELSAAISAADAAPSPILAATMRLTLAEFLRERAGRPGDAAGLLDDVLRTLPSTTDPELRAELHLARGLARQEMGVANPGYLLPAVNDFTEAAKVYREDTHPELFATVNEHLALAYLVMPMSSEGDRIRVGVAVNSLRAALRIYTPETHPVQWASAQLNLANALQYLPSVHQEDNLDEAVHLYEQLLQYRDEESDPLGLARILANQGNALGHLGVFADARERLERARALFMSCGDVESASGVDEILSSLTEAQAGAV